MATDLAKQEGAPEAAADSTIVITNLLTPGGVLEGPIHMSSENTVEEEVRNVIQNNGLHMAAARCTFVLTDSQGSHTWLDRDEAIEEVIDLLTSYAQIELLKIGDTPQGLTPLNEMGVVPT